MSLKLIRTDTVWTGAGVDPAMASGGQYYWLTNNLFSANVVDPPANSIFTIDLTAGFDFAMIEWAGKILATTNVSAVSACNVRGACAVMPYVDATVDYLQYSLLKRSENAFAPAKYASAEAGVLMGCDTTDGNAVGNYAINTNLAQGAPLPILGAAALAPGMFSRFYLWAGFRTAARLATGAGTYNGLPTVSGMKRLSFCLKWLPTITVVEPATCTISGKLMVHLFREYTRSMR